MVYVEKGQKELNTIWPHDKGLTARTQTQTGRVMNLEPQLGTLVLRRYRVGII